MKDAIARLICFLVGHDLQLYRLTYRNRFRLVCRRCHDPNANTLADVWQRFIAAAENSEGKF